MAPISTDSPEPEVVLDLSRLLSRVRHATPTGIDRCEMAYARGLLAAIPERLHFGAVHPIGRYGRLERDAALGFLDETEHRWLDNAEARAPLRREAARMLWALRPRPVPTPRREGGRVYVQPSPNNLTNGPLVRSILRREQARYLCLVHDLIPIQYPEYAVPGGDALHRRRVETMAREADGLIANSQATLDAIRPYLDRVPRRRRTAVAALGVETVAAPPPAASDRPYFVCIGTIEPRKNHLLLLHLWRAMSEARGAAAVPRLILIGRRGWENEQVVDMLERCPALAGCVEERTGLPDRAMRSLLAGARALLLPSFAEGYGMPVSDALAMGVPVLCSDLPALREGGNVPDFLDPLDGPAWRRAIEDYAMPASPMRQAQLDRMREWTAPTWHRHIAILLDMLHKVGS